MKNKFDILYEDILDYLKKAEVSYQTNDEFKQQIIDELNYLKENDTEDGIKSYLKFTYDEKIKKENSLWRDDRLNALNEACLEVFNKSFDEILNIDDIENESVSDELTLSEDKSTIDQLLEVVLHLGWFTSYLDIDSSSMSTIRTDINYLKKLINQLKEESKIDE